MEKKNNEYSDLLKIKLSKISHSKARKFLFKHGYNSSSFTMPDYYQAIGFEKMKLNKITDWNKVPRTTTIDIFTPKGNLSWRRFSFIHPYMYWQIVNIITDEKNWEKIRKHLCQNTLISCYSVPSFSLAQNQTVQAKCIVQWIQMAERDIIKNCVNYNSLAITDIQNFYSSIYTHSIAWALHSKDNARNDRWKRDLVGNKLDKLFQNSRDTQTNGIPVGSMVSDIISEIILTKIDVELSRWIKKEKLESTIIVSRFRDDYRILSKRVGDINKFLKKLNRTLHEDFDLILNPNKTFVYEDIIEKTFRPWDQEIKHSFLLRKIKNRELPEEKISFNLLRDILLETYKIQIKYPQGRAGNIVLSNLAILLNGKDIYIKESYIPELIAILRKIALVREEVTPYSILLVDTLIDKFNKTKKKQFILEMISIFKGQQDVDFQLIWLYRLCLHQAPELCTKILNESNYESKLLDIVHNYNEYNKNKNYYEIFSDASNIQQSDKDELKKFKFINIKKIEKAKKEKISPISISPFKLIKYD